MFKFFIQLRFTVSKCEGKLNFVRLCKNFIRLVDENLYNRQFIYDSENTPGFLNKTVSLKDICKLTAHKCICINIFNSCLFSRLEPNLMKIFC